MMEIDGWTRNQDSVLQNGKTVTLMRVNGFKATGVVQEPFIINQLRQGSRVFGKVDSLWDLGR